MAKILCEERVVEYTKEFKFKVVELTERLPVTTAEISEVFDLHPVMVYRWRQEFREGKLIYEPTRRISMTKEKVAKKATDDELKELKTLRKENARLQKENDILKKWQVYLAEVKQKNSRS